MSGHSKWSQIKRQKGAADVKRGNLFTKLSNTITIAAHDGGNPENNFKLRLAIDKAKSFNMPNDNIERAIQRGTGELQGEKIEELLFEGYGPGGVAVVVEAVSDNRNRTTSEIRNILNKYQGKLGERGSVSWMFERQGVIVLGQIENRETLELQLIEAGAEDIQEEKAGTVIYTQPEKLQSMKEYLEKQHLPIEYAEVALVPKNPITLSASNDNSYQKMVAELENNEAVNNWYSNAKE